MRYYFHYRGPEDELVADHLGSELDGIELVEQEAHVVASDILHQELRDGRPMSAPRCLKVEDERGEIVLYVPFWASLATNADQALRTIN